MKAGLFESSADPQTCWPRRWRAACRRRAASRRWARRRVPLPPPRPAPRAFRYICRTTHLPDCTVRLLCDAHCHIQTWFLVPRGSSAAQLRTGSAGQSIRLHGFVVNGASYALSSAHFLRLNLHGLVLQAAGSGLNGMPGIPSPGGPAPIAAPGQPPGEWLRSERSNRDKPCWWWHDLGDSPLPICASASAAHLCSDLSVLRIWASATRLLQHEASHLAARRDTRLPSNNHTCRSDVCRCGCRRLIWLGFRFLTPGKGAAAPGTSVGQPTPQRRGVSTAELQRILQSGRAPSGQPITDSQRTQIVQQLRLRQQVCHSSNPTTLTPSISRSRSSRRSCSTCGCGSGCATRSQFRKS